MKRNYYDTEVTDLTYDWIVKSKIATEQEIRLVTSIIGYSLESLNDIIFARTGYQDMIQHPAGAVESVIDEQRNSLFEPIDNVEFVAW